MGGGFSRVVASVFELVGNVSTATGAHHHHFKCLPTKMPPGRSLRLGATLELQNE